MKQEKIDILRECILTKDITNEAKNSILFGGADISIVPELPTQKNSFYGDPLFVVTRFPKELSWLIYQLKEIFIDDLDYINKYPFYIQLAESANKSISINNENLTSILIAILDEAEKMIKAFE